MGHRMVKPRCYGLGRGIQYLLRGQNYDLRSAGPDEIFLARDDIVVRGQMGRNIPCELRNEDRVSYLRRPRAEVRTSIS